MPERIALPERLTLEDAAATLARLEGQLGQQADATVMLDASSLRSFDSSSLAVLLELRRRLQARGKHLQVDGWPPRLRDLAGLYGVEGLLSPS
jgi:phospholipid transport system transporter-binding protein